MLTIIYGRLLNLRRNWLPYAFMLILPMILMFVFGAVVDTGENGVFLPVADMDDSQYSRALVDELRRIGIYNISLASPEQIKEMVMENRAEAGLVIPPDFEAWVAGGQVPSFGLVISRETTTGYSIQGVLTAAVQRLAYNTTIVKGTVEVLDKYIDLDNEQKGKLENRVYSLVTQEWEEKLPIGVVSSTLKGGGQGVSFDMYTQTSIGFTLAFTMFAMIFAVAEILEEKRFRVWDRINVSPVSRFQILAGSLLYAFVLGMTQMVFMVLVGDLVLGVGWLENAGGAAVILSAFCFCIVSLGLLLSFGIKTSQQLQVIAPVILVSMGMLGGCYWPLEIVSSKVMLAASRAVPTGWAMKALKDMIVYNQGFEVVYLPAAVMLLMGLVFMGTAMQLSERA